MPSTRRSLSRVLIALAFTFLPACRHHSSPVAPEEAAPLSQLKHLVVVLVPKVGREAHEHVHSQVQFLQGRLFGGVGPDERMVTGLPDEA